jgi:hypothetical protein
VSPAELAAHLARPSDATAGDPRDKSSQRLAHRLSLARRQAPSRASRRPIPLRDCLELISCAGMGNDLPELTVTDAGGWRAWLGDHHRDPTGVWLVPAKKGTTEPTSLMYDQALDEALCIQRRLVALRTLEFLTFWTYLANRGVWEALVGAGPTCWSSTS